MTDATASGASRTRRPGAIEAALRELLLEQYARDDACVPARVLNLVVVVDREWRGEILNRLERRRPLPPVATDPVRGRAGPHDDRRDGDDRRPRATRRAGELGAGAASGSCSTSARATSRSCDSIVDPLVVTDIATVTWSPHGHPEAVDALLHLSQVVLVDSVNELDARDGRRRARELARGGVRGRPGVAALDAVARAGRGDVRPAAVARRARPDRLGDGAPPPRIGGARACCSAGGWRRGWGGSPARWSARTARCTEGARAPRRRRASSWSRTRRCRCRGWRASRSGRRAG